MNQNEQLLLVGLGIAAVWWFSRRRDDGLRLIPTDNFGVPIDSRTAKPLKTDMISTYTNEYVVNPDRDVAEAEELITISPWHTAK